MVALASHVIALDLGTTTIKAGLVDQHCELNAYYALAAPEISVKGGRYESDALRYVEQAEQLLLKCLINSQQHPSLGIACQRSSFLLWEKATGKPVTPLISWQDNRGADCVARLASRQSDIQKLTGLRLTPYYLAPKLSVLLDQQPGLHIGLERGALLVGTLDCFVVWRWSRGRYYQTDASMAARTLLMSIHQQHWSLDLRSLFNLSACLLPDIKPSCGLNQRLMQGVVLQASVADQSAAFVASVQNDPQHVLVNLGTGGFVIRLQTNQAVYDNNNYLNTLLYQALNGRCYYAIEGTLNAINSALTVLPYQHCQFEDFGQIADIFCIAEPAGIGAPYFRPDIGLVFSGSIDQLTQHQIAVLLLEAIIFRIVRILDDFHQYQTITSVILSGGLSELACLQQGIAQCCQFKVCRLMHKESTLIGAGVLAMNLGVDYPQTTERLHPGIENQGLLAKYQNWKKWLDEMLCR